MSAPLQRDRIAVALLVACVAGFWVTRVLLPGREVSLLTSDVFLYYLPIYELLYASLLRGELPLWNPWQICGLPGLASLQAGFFYPPHVVYLLLPSTWAFGLSSALHLCFAAAGTWLVCRRLGLGLGAALFGALVVGLRGRYPAMVFFPNMLEASVWLPWGALAVLALARAGSLRACCRPAVGLGACMALSLLAGYPQVSVYLGYSWGALLLLFLAFERPPAAGWARAMAFGLLGIGLGVALAALQLLPGLELANQGTRSPGGLERGEMFPFGWAGPPVSHMVSWTLQTPFPLVPLSLGGVVLVLLPAIPFDRRFRVIAVGGLLLATGVLLFAMGPVTPLFDWMLELPTLSWFRFPRRALFAGDFFLALALAVACEGLSRGGEGRSRPGAWLLAGLCIAAALLVQWRADFEMGIAPGLLGAVVAVGVAVVVLGRGLPAGLPVALLLALLLAIEMFWAAPNPERLFFVPGAEKVYHRPHPAYERIAGSSQRAWIRATGINPALPPKLASYFRMRSVGDYEPLNLRRQAEYFTWLTEGRLRPRRKARPYSGRLKHLTEPTYPRALKERGHLLDVAAVEWFLMPKEDSQDFLVDRYLRTHGFELDPVEGPDFDLWRNPKAFPRAFSVYELRPAPPPEKLLPRLADRRFDPLRASYAEGLVVERAPGAPRRGAPARFLRDEPTLVELEVELAAAGALVLADSFYPGWRASVDGEPLRIHPVNHLFRGVALPAGRHVVRFEFVPTTFHLGAGISFGALVAGALLLRVRGWPPRDPERDPKRDPKEPR